MPPAVMRAVLVELQKLYDGLPGRFRDTAAGDKALEAARRRVKRAIHRICQVLQEGGGDGRFGCVPRCLHDRESHACARSCMRLSSCL